MRNPEISAEYFVAADNSNINNKNRAPKTNESSSANQMIVEGLSGDHYKDLTLAIQPGTNTIIIGDNIKARKELIQDLANPESQGIRLPKDARVEYVTPSLTDIPNKDITLKDFFFEARNIAGIEEEMTQLWEKASEDPEALEQAGRLQTRFEQAGGWEAESEIIQLLEGLSVAGHKHDTIDLDTKLEHMSSGQISKAIIAKALFSRAGIIVMDDPSVHLDVHSKQWLAEYIKHSQQATIIATSDMEFATNIGDRVVEILDSTLTLNIGTNLANYEVERKKIIDNWLDEASRKKDEIDELTIKIRDFYAPAAKKSDDMAQVKRAQESKLQRMRDEYDGMPGKILLESRQGKQTAPRIFELANRPGKDVFSCEDVSLLYINDDPSRESTVIEIPKLNIYSGDRLAIVGNNGSGKSTLMRYIAQQDNELVTEGESKTGLSIEPGYYSVYTSLPDEDMPLRLILGRYVRDPMAILSYWGFDRTEYYDTTPADLTQNDEKARAQFALLMAKKPNLLLLDEPTSYLTPTYQEKLLDAIRGYDEKGTLLVVSHDPVFLSKLELKGRITMPGARREDAIYGSRVNRYPEKSAPKAASNTRRNLGRATLAR